MRMTARLTRGGLLAALSIGLIAGAATLDVAAFAQWPEFRGPSGQGHAEGTSVPLDWSEAKNIRWKVPVPGAGWSSPVVADGRVWLTTAVAGARGGASLRALAFDAESGRELVNVEVFRISASKAPNSKNSLASPTPIWADGHVYRTLRS